MVLPQAMSVDNSDRGLEGRRMSIARIRRRRSALAHSRVRAAVKKLGLSQRRAQIVEKLAAGKSTQALAKELHISEGTVHSHLAKIFAKLEISSRAELLSLVLAKVLEASEDRTEQK